MQRISACAARGNLGCIRVKGSGHSRILNEFDERATRRPGMEKGNEVVAGTRTGLTVDEFVTLSVERGESRADIGNTVGDVVKPRTSTLEKSRDGGIGVYGRDQFDPSDAAADEDDFDALGLDAFTSFRPGADECFPEGNRFIERSDRDSHVVQRVFGHRLRYGGGVGLCRST